MMSSYILLAQLFALTSNGIFIIGTANALPQVTNLPQIIANVSKSNTKDLQIVTTSSTFHENFTTYLGLNCSFHHDPNSSMALVTSMIISKYEDDDSIRDIATITLVSKDKVMVTDNLKAEVKGHITMIGGTSYISYQWRYPSVKVEGQYQCVVHGMDQKGIGTTITAGNVLKSQSIDQDLIVEMFHQQEERQVAILSELEEVKVQLEEAKQMINTTGPRPVTFKTMLSFLMVNTSFIFEAHFAYKGHFYFLSPMKTINIEEFEIFCNRYDGYLLEIDTVEEFDHIKKEVTALELGDYYIYTGMTDAGREDHWVYRTSGEEVTYTKWSSGEPTRSTSQNCIRLKASENLAMYDYNCIVGADKARFMCEVPCGEELPC